MTAEESAARLKQLKHGINEDGTVEGYLVETRSAAVHAQLFPEQYGYEVDHENKFISFTIDAGGTDEEVRLPFELVADMQKWIKAGPDPLP